MTFFSVLKDLKKLLNLAKLNLNIRSANLPKYVYCPSPLTYKYHYNPLYVIKYSTPKR